MKTRISTIRQNIETLDALVGDIVIPEGIPPYMIVLSVDGTPSITINCPEGTDENSCSQREQLLDLAGRWFGKTGWVRRRSYDNKTFTWLNDAQGVRLQILGAELIPLPVDKTPVSPGCFPILLEAPESPQDRTDRHAESVGDLQRDLDQDHDL